MEIKKIENRRAVACGDFPVVRYEGKCPVLRIGTQEITAAEYFIEDDGTVQTAACQSGGCDYCDGDDPACRRTDRNAGRATVWCI